MESFIDISLKTEMFNRHSVKMRIIGLILMVLVLLVASCEEANPDRVELNIQPGVVQIIYEGLEAGEYGDVGVFQVINDSSATVHYMGYAPAAPFYTSEALADTGWTPVIWGWCGTGAQLLELKPDSSFELIIQPPDYSCTWRVGISITDTLFEEGYQLLSEPLQYTKP